MKTMIILTAVLTAAALSAEPLSLANGLEVRVPAGWQATRTEQGAVMLPPNAVSGSEAYIVAMLPAGTNPRDPRLLSTLAAQYSSSGVQGASLGAPVAFQAAGGPGFVHSYDFVESGQAGRLQFYLVSLKSGSVAAVIAAGLRDIVPTRAAAVMSIASSLTQSPTAAPAASAAMPAAPAGSAGPLASQWTTRLAGKKLMQFSSYSSGSSGGMSSQKSLILAADGSYAFRTSSSVSIYVPGANGSSAGRNGSDGKWRVVEQNGQPVLELVNNQGGRENIILSTDGSKTFLNGHRWLMAPIQ